MNNYLPKLKFFFYFINVLLIIIYLYPGSLLGYAVNRDISNQPQLTPDFIISSNHFYAFILVSVIGFFSYSKSKYINILFIYLIFLSSILEILHLIIPKRSFQFSDLFGNIFGVLVVLIIYYIFITYEKFKN
jgi:hypothetical protein